MATTKPLHALAWAVALGVPLLAACDRRDTSAPNVSMSSSEVGGSGLTMGTPNEQTSGVAGTDAAREAPATSGGDTTAALPGGTLDDTMESPAAGHGASKPLSEPEQRFVREAIQAGLYEVAVAALAADRAQGDSTRRMAELLLNDHRTANDKLQQLAKGRMTIPTDIPAEKQATIDKLSQAKGEEFDKQFIELVGIRDHQKDIQLFESAQKDIKDAELKLFVQNTLPTLKHHLSSAQDMRSVRKPGS